MPRKNWQLPHLPPNGITRKGLYILVFLVSIVGSCKPKFRAAPVPPKGASTFKLSGIFTNCKIPLSSSNIITYKLDVIVWYKRGNDKFELDKQSLSSTTPGSSTFVVNSFLPTDRTEWYIEITVTGTQCSTCALTQYGANNICLQVDNGTGITAAKPRLGFTSYTQNSFLPTINISDWMQLSNAPRSCDCEVPHN